MATYIVKSNQNLYDVALHLYGTIEGLFDLLISNPTLSMTSELTYGQELEYHEGFVINPSIVSEFQSKNIIPSSGQRSVYYKQPTEDLIMIVPVSNELKYSSFKVAGEGDMIIDWGDNTDFETITLTPGAYQRQIEHYFNSEVETRRIRIYGDTETLMLTYFDTTGLGGALVLCKPFVVDTYICTNRRLPLTGLALFRETFSLTLTGCGISSLLPIGDLHLQTLDLRNVEFDNQSVLDDYLVYIADGKHYDDRRPCDLFLSQEPGTRGYEAMNTILGEKEWNQSGNWHFIINEQIYVPDNGTDSQ